MKKQKTIIIGISGGIAAYKVPELVRGLKKKGYNVKVIMTKNALHFITPLTMQTVSENPVITDMFTPLEIESDMFYVYVIRSKKDGQLYTGSTCDLRRRFREHNNGAVPSTKARVPFEMIYYEVSVNEQDAREREKYLKSGMGKRYLKNRLKRFLSHTTSLRDKSLTGFIANAGSNAPYKLYR